jgi:hypothetical protein
MGVFEGQKKILASPYHPDAFTIGDPDCPYRRIGRRSFYIYPFLARHRPVTVDKNIRAPLTIQCIPNRQPDGPYKIKAAHGPNNFSRRPDLRVSCYQKKYFGPFANNSRLRK